MTCLLSVYLLCHSLSLFWVRCGLCWSSGVFQCGLLSGTKDVVTGLWGAEGCSGGTDAGVKGLVSFISVHNIFEQLTQHRWENHVTAFILQLKRFDMFCIYLYLYIYVYFQILIYCSILNMFYSLFFNKKMSLMSSIFLLFFFLLKYWFRHWFRKKTKTILNPNHYITISNQVPQKKNICQNCSLDSQS